jgi:5-methylcytosine-specific restriction endonuclease McrA
MDTTNISKANERKTGSAHPRWNPNKAPLIEYGRKVRVLSEKTYQENLSNLNPDNLPRTLCGIDGGYQLDHKISIKNGFVNNIPPERLSSVDNLQLLPWKDNRKKWF